jgi:hypothetical protein
MSVLVARNHSCTQPSSSPFLCIAGHEVGGFSPTAIVLKVLGKCVNAFRTASWVRRHEVVIVPCMGVLEATLPLQPWGMPYTMFLLSASGRIFETKVALVSVGGKHY